jgi:hypothetical protein
MSQRISFDQFGVEFFRQVLTSTNIGPKIESQLPPPVSGETTAINLGPVHLIKVRYTAKALGIRMHDTGVGLYRVDIGLDVSVDVETKNFRMRVEPAFGLIAEAYTPLTLFFNLRLVRSEEIVITPTTPVDGVVDQKIFQEICTQLRQQITDQVNTSLLKSNRSFDVLAMAGSMSGSSRVALARLDASPLPMPLPPIPVGNVAAASPFSVDRAPTVDAAGEDMFAAAQRLTPQQFGNGFMNLIVTANVVEKKINQALLSSQHGGNFISGQDNLPVGRFEYSGAVFSTQVQLKESSSERLLFFFWIPIRVDLAIHVVGTESWTFSIHAPVWIEAQTMSDCSLNFYVYPLTPEGLSVTNQQTSLTGITWNLGVETQLRQKVAEQINQGLQGAERSIDLAKLVKEALK